MTRRDRWIVGASAAAVMALMSLPLAFVLPMAVPADSGIAARSAEGSVWRGLLREVNIAGLPIGDTRVALRVLPLFVGEARLGFGAPALRGTLVASSGSVGLLDATGTVDLAGRLRPLPLTRFNLDGVTTEFREERCTADRKSVV